MRLIDGAIQPMLLANYILERKDNFVKVLEKGDNDFLFAMLMDYFDAQPTAYDPDKVVRQLEEIRPEEDCFDNAEEYKHALSRHNKIIEIVKGGGVDGN